MSEQRAAFRMACELRRLSIATPLAVRDKAVLEDSAAMLEALGLNSAPLSTGEIVAWLYDYSSGARGPGEHRQFISEMLTQAAKRLESLQEHLERKLA